MSGLHTVIEVRYQYRYDRLLSRISSTLTRDIDIAMSVRLSVRHVPVFYGKLKRLNILSQFLHHVVAQTFNYYEYQKYSRNSDGVTPSGALNTGRV